MTAHLSKSQNAERFIHLNHAFTVMMRLSDKQFEEIYNHVHKYTQGYIDKRYPCGDGGWIHYRVTCKEHLDDIQKLLEVKCL